jgi:hypothetical protein
MRKEVGFGDELARRTLFVGFYPASTAVLSKNADRHERRHPPIRAEHPKHVRNNIDARLLLETRFVLLPGKDRFARIGDNTG